MAWEQKLPKHHIIIAIDGPAASGKGTLARRLAKQLGWPHMDTGLLYRSVGYDHTVHGLEPIAAAQTLAADFSPKILENPELRSDETGQAASKVAIIPEVREALLMLQKNFANSPQIGSGGVILDGRDTGTVIAPEADFKFFVTASLEVRAERRAKELQSKGISVTYEAVLTDMRARDDRDASRSSAPMKAAQDAIVIDSSDLSIEAMVEKALQIISH